VGNYEVVAYEKRKHFVDERVFRDDLTKDQLPPHQLKICCATLPWVLKNVVMIHVHEGGYLLDLGLKAALLQGQFRGWHGSNHYALDLVEAHLVAAATLRAKALATAETQLPGTVRE
jgi:hypothetical protein